MFLHIQSIWWEVFYCKHKLEVYKETIYKKVSIYANLCPHSPVLWLCTEDPPCLPWPLCQEGQPGHFGALKCASGRKGPFRALEECQGLSSLNVLSAVTVNDTPACFSVLLDKKALLTLDNLLGCGKYPTAEICTFSSESEEPCMNETFFPTAFLLLCLS